MGNSMDARSAREALIVEALRGVDAVLAAADAVGERLLPARSGWNLPLPG